MQAQARFQTARAVVVDAVEPRSIAKFFGNAEDLYQMGPTVGVGAQGQVYKCEKLSTCMCYAAKVVDTWSTRGTRSNFARESLEEEIQNMRRLEHPCIMKVVEDFWERGERIIVMDFAQHGDMHCHIEQELMACQADVFPGHGGSELASRHVVRQLLGAIGYMHKNRVIHRDLKLHNVLIMDKRVASGCVTTGSDPAPTELLAIKISDFGLSRYTGDHDKPAFSDKVGTPAFVAPEVVQEDHYDEMVDYWGLGVMVYVMLCGELPFDAGKCRANFVNWHTAAVALGISECEEWRQASAEARALVKGLLDADPQARYGLERSLESAWLAQTDDAPAQSQVALGPLNPPTGTSAARDSGDRRLQAGGQQRTWCGVGGGASWTAAGARATSTVTAF
mmetsp:Transcript_92267/g.238128  ORF Transcript_92267/g.238128 Transcript_92267/m.238128 type:complete len:393 (-) Transcript_92267:614-1792(-)